MQSDNELVALKPQWLPNRRGASSSVFLANKGEHNELDRTHAHGSTFAVDPHLRAPPLQSNRPQSYSDTLHHTHSSQPSPSSASAAVAGGRNSYFAASGPSQGQHQGHQREAGGSGSSSSVWGKPSGSSSSAGLPSSSSSPLLAPAASPRASLAPPSAPSSARRAGEPASDPFAPDRSRGAYQPPHDRDRDARAFSPGRGQASVGAAGSGSAANNSLADPPPWSSTAGGGAGSSNWSGGPAAAGRPAAAGSPQDAGRNGSAQQQQQRQGSAMVEPASPPAPSPAAGQAVYQKVVFEKEFPSLKDSKHPLGYAPKEAPYKQTFLSSRVMGNWTSKLADAPAPAPAAATAPGAAAGAGSRSGQNDAGLASELQQPQQGGVGGLFRPGAGAGGDAAGPGGGAAATPGTGAGVGGAQASGWGSFAQAAVTGGASGGAGAGGVAGTGAEMSTDKLREQLAMKQSKQLIPVIARKDDSGSGGAGRGRLGTGTAGVGGRASSAAAALAPGGKPAGSSTLLLHPGGKMQLSSGSAVLASNGTVLLTKRAAAPLDKPLLPLAASISAPRPSLSPSPATTPQGAGSASPEATQGRPGGQEAQQTGGSATPPRTSASGLPTAADLSASRPSSTASPSSAAAAAGAAVGHGLGAGAGSCHSSGSGGLLVGSESAAPSVHLSSAALVAPCGGRSTPPANGMRELLIPERRGYAVAYSALVDGAVDEAAGGKVPVVLPARPTTPAAPGMQSVAPSSWQQQQQLALEQQQQQQQQQPHAVAAPVPAVASPLAAGPPPPLAQQQQQQHILAPVASRPAAVAGVAGTYHPLHSTAAAVSPAPGSMPPHHHHEASKIEALQLEAAARQARGLGAEEQRRHGLGLVEEQGSQGLELAELANLLPGDLLAPAPEQPAATGSPMGTAHAALQLAPTPDPAPSSPGASAAKFLVSSEEEEFLRSLGWTDAEDGTDDVLTEEEIAAFQASSQARGVLGPGSVAAVPPQAPAHVPAVSFGPWGSSAAHGSHTMLGAGPGFGVGVPGVGYSSPAPGAGYASSGVGGIAAPGHGKIGAAAAAAPGLGSATALLQPLGCRLGGLGTFGTLTAPLAMAGAHVHPSAAAAAAAAAQVYLHHPHPRVGGPGTAGSLGYAAAQLAGARPIGVPVPVSVARGTKLGLAAACSFGSEVSVTDSEDL